jgi:ribosomal protein S18 acetylase RimI-like enzyme
MVLCRDVVMWCNTRSEQAGKTPVYYKDDAQAIVMLPLDSVHPSMGLTSTNSGNLMLGKFIKNVLIGSAGLSMNRRRHEQHRATVVSTYVRRNYAGRGVGTALLRELIVAAQAHPALEQLHLTITVGNDSAPALSEARLSSRRSRAGGHQDR